MRKDFQTSHEFIRGNCTLALENVANEPWLFHTQPPGFSEQLAGPGIRCLLSVLATTSYVILGNSLSL